MTDGSARTMPAASGRVPVLSTRRAYGVPAAGALSPVPIPLAFPSIAHMDARIAALNADAQDTGGRKETTCRWIRASYRSFRTFLLSNGEDRFVRGDVREQVAILRGWIAWLGPDGGRERYAFVNAPLKGLLTAYERQRELRHLDAPEFFVNPRTKPGIGEITIRRYVRRLADAAQVKWSPHMLRHSFVTHLLESGTPVHVVRNLAGHRNVATTLNYYAAAFDDNRRDAIESLRY